MAEIHGLTLVTGGTGFLGGRVIERLVADGTPVRALARRELPPHLRTLDVQTHRGDLVDARTVAPALDGVDTVIHCAGLVTDYAPYRDFMRVNGAGTANLVDAAVRAGVRRFVHVSTVDVYGFPSAGREEATPMRPIGLGYGDSKIMGEHVVRNGGARHGLQFSIVRPGSIYGPRSVSFVTGLVRLLKKGQMVIVGDGQVDAGLAYVDNVVDMLLACATQEVAVGKAYNACDCTHATWQAYLDALAEIAGARPCRRYIPAGLAAVLGTVMERAALLVGARRRPVLTRMAVKIFALNQCHPNGKARRDLGWSPRVDFAGGMRRIADWMEEGN